MKRSVKFVAVAMLLAALGLGFWPSFSGAQQPSPSGAVPPGIIVKPPGESDLQIGVQVGPGPYIAGRQVEADFITLGLNKQAVVYLLLINPEKEVTIGGVTSKVREVRLLFPNRDFQGNFLQKGEYKFPGPGLWERPFEISGPPGTAYVQVVATPVPIGLEPQAFEEPFPLLGIAPDLVKQDIERRIQQKGLTPADWDATWTQYEALRTVPLTPQPTGNLIVTVIDQKTRSELWGAEISVAGTIRAITNELGKAMITHLLPATYNVTVARNGYKPATKAVEITAGRDSEVKFELEPLPRRASLTVSPTTATIFQPIAFDASESSGPIILYEWDFQSDGIIDRRTKTPKMTITPGEAGLLTGPSLVRVIVVFDDAAAMSESVRIYVTGPVPPPPPPGEPGTSTIEGTGEVNPITLKIIQGKIAFVVFHGSYHWARQLGELRVSRDAQGKWLPATLSFDYNFRELPVRDMKSFVRLLFYRYNEVRGQWECLTLEGKPEPVSDLTKCEGTKEKFSVALPASDKVGTWFSGEFRDLRFPDEALYVVATVELHVSRNTTSKPVKIEYRNIRLKS